MTIDREERLNTIERADKSEIPHFTGPWSETDLLRYMAKEQDRISYKLSKLLAAILIELQDLNEKIACRSSCDPNKGEKT